MSRRDRRKKSKGPKRDVAAGADMPWAPANRSPLTQAWKGRMERGVVRRGERQPGRSS